MLQTASTVTRSAASPFWPGARQSTVPATGEDVERETKTEGEGYRECQCRSEP
jgi:hypothetical protein